MDSILDSLTWEDGSGPQAGRVRHRWLKRLLVLLAAVATLVVLFVP